MALTRDLIVASQIAATRLPLREMVREQDPSIAIDSVLTMDERVGASLSTPRSYAVLLGGFATFALLIAGTGLFAVLSYTVTATRELKVES